MDSPSKLAILAEMVLLKWNGVLGRLAALCDGTRGQEKGEPHESDASTNTVVDDPATNGGAKIDNAGECRVSERNRGEQERAVRQATNTRAGEVNQGTIS